MEKIAHLKIEIVPYSRSSYRSIPKPTAGARGEKRAETIATPRRQPMRFAALTLGLVLILTFIVVLIPKVARAEASAPLQRHTQNETALTRNAVSSEPDVVANLDLKRFLGTWYEISSIPQFFERNCVATHATYTPLANGEIEVFNQCLNKTFSGRERSIHGRAWAADASVPAKLRVQFFWPLSGAYWVIAIDENATWVITGSPDRKNLWILSKTPTLPDALYQSLLKLAADQGYRTSDLKLTPQPALN